MPSAASLFFSCAPSGEAEQVAPTPIKRGVQGRSSGGKGYPFRPAAKGVPDCPGIKKVPHPARAGYGTSLIGWVMGMVAALFLSMPRA